MIAAQRTPFPLALALLLFAGCPGEVDDDVNGDDDASGDDDATGDDDTSTVDPEEIDPQRIHDDVTLLSSDEFGGREPGTEGNEAAVEYVEGVFEALGLEPAGDQGSYRQSFPMDRWLQLAPADVSLGGQELGEGQDYLVFSYSGAGQVDAELVFAGYGMTVPPFDAGQYPDCPLDPAGYDDYAGIDLTGKVALVVRHGPGDDEAVHDNCPANEAALELPALWTFGYKAANARLHGASALALVNHYDAGASPPEGYLGGDYYTADFPAVTLHRGLVESAVPELSEWVTGIDENLQPAGSPTGVPISIEVAAEIQSLAVPNVIGVIPGVDEELGDEVVLVGSHLDHVGTDPGTGEIYNGADDNASGTAVMMELARMLAGSGYEPARTFVFAGWNAEELGLVGSCYYVGEPAFPIEDTILALSVDMVGSGDGSGLNLFGGLTPEDAWFGDLMSAAIDEQGLSYEIVPAPPTFNSDHACFSFAGTTGLLAL
ncbi:MAG: M28 family peptidase, partial [Myxococcota bacterium]|nr:M28 family peptidase [Myxococcota bacterium]